jgi:hypothetical protein
VLTLGVLRMVIAAAKNKELELKHLLTDTEMLDVIRKEAKKRKESIASFTAGNRPELAAQEARELAVLDAYLPAMMSDREVAAMVARAVAAAPVQEFGPLMKIIIAETGGRADAGMVSKILKSVL